MCSERTLYDHIRLGDGGETSVKRVNLSRSKKALKNDATYQLTKCFTSSKINRDNVEKAARLGRRLGRF